MDLNRFQTIGNLTKDGELKQTQDGASFITFTVASNWKYKNKTTGELVEEAEYTDFIAWGKFAETIAPMIKKGKKVFAEGRKKTNAYDDENGTKRYRVMIVLQEFIMLSKKEGGLAVTPDEADYFRDSIVE